MTEEEVRFWICRFRELDTTKEEHRQRLIDSFVNAVYVYDDKILLIFNYKDGQETVPLKEANDSDLSGGCPPFIGNAAVKTAAFPRLPTGSKTGSPEIVFPDEPVVWFQQAHKSMDSDSKIQRGLYCLWIRFCGYGYTQVSIVSTTG